jgi:excisionase family DNA binding protein
VSRPAPQQNLAGAQIECLLQIALEDEDLVTTSALNDLGEFYRSEGAPARALADPRETGDMDPASASDRPSQLPGRATKEQQAAVRPTSGGSKVGGAVGAEPAAGIGDVLLPARPAGEVEEGRVGGSCHLVPTRYATVSTEKLQAWHSRYGPLRAPDNGPNEDRGGRVDRLLTVRDAAAVLNVHPVTLRRMIARGDIPFLRIGQRAVRLSRGDLELWLTAARRGRPLEDLRAAASP